MLLPFEGVSSIFKIRVNKSNSRTQITESITNHAPRIGLYLASTYIYQYQILVPNVYQCNKIHPLHWIDCVEYLDLC